MKIKNLQITSASTLDMAIDSARPIHILCGKYSALALDLIRELIGDYGAKNDPDSFDNGHFLIHSELESNDKKYSVCYIRNAERAGEHKLAADFTPNSLDYSMEDTKAFIRTCNRLDVNATNVVTDPECSPSETDDRPLFVYVPAGTSITAYRSLLDRMVEKGRQVFVSVCDAEPDTLLDQARVIFAG